MERVCVIITKGKILEKIKKHKTTIILWKSIIVLVKLNKGMVLKSDFDIVKKLAIKKKLNYMFLKESVEILEKGILNCNNILHSIIKINK